MSHWDDLSALKDAVGTRRIDDLFADADRAETFSAATGDMLFD